ncbi:MAG: ATP-binding protein [Pseudomonadota bacterium]
MTVDLEGEKSFCVMERRSNETRPDTDQSVLKDLVDGFVHEVKNTLTSIRVAVKILGGKMAPTDPNREIVQQVYDQLGKINKTLSEMIEFTHISTPKASLTDINKVVEQSLRRIRSECQRHEVEVEKHLGESLPEIELDARQIELAFLHLFLDMLNAMPDGGRLAVRSVLDPSGYILLEIEDTGISIPETHMERLFKPFLSTMGRGAGTRLSIAKRILEQNGGFIQARNRGEGGLTFRIVFPFFI